MSAVHYRRDIDGLRAIAVLPIVLFHAGVSIIPGGFVGVDIFFVISGFLITSIIYREMGEGRFSILEFYRRRVVRIVPALFVLIATTLVLGRLILLPGELRELGDSAASAAAFGSNIYFWRTGDYFAGSAESKVLLHTWSLGVEEQFYIFYPLMLLLVQRLAPRRLTAALALVGALSFAYGVLLEIKVPGGSANFYLLPTRTWELALGGLIAAGALPRAASTGARNAWSLFGLALIGLGLCFIQSDSSFPIPWAILPCFGAALLIAQGQGGVTERLLGAAPVTWIGRSSYSLYLWHWPIIVFYRLSFGGLLAPAQTAALVLASIIAAALSRKFIELPFLSRFRSGRPAAKVIAGLAALAVLAAAGLALSHRYLGARTLPPAVARVAAYGDYAGSPIWRYQYRRGPCFAGEGENYIASKCLVFSSTKRNVVVLGDSHAAMYWRSIMLVRPRDNVIQATASGCRPVMSFVGSARCTKMVRLVLGPLVAGKRIDEIILAGRWKKSDLGALGPTIRWLRAGHIAVTVIGPTVEYDSDFARILARAMLRHDYARIEQERLTAQAEVDRSMATIVPAAGGKYVSAYSIECPRGQQCIYQAPDGAPMQFDYGHLTLSGANYVIKRSGI